MVLIVAQELFPAGKSLQQSAVTGQTQLLCLYQAAVQELDTPVPFPVLSKPKTMNDLKKQKKY